MCEIEFTICDDCSRVHRVTLIYCDSVIATSGVSRQTRTFQGSDFRYVPRARCTGLRFERPVLEDGRCDLCNPAIDILMEVDALDTAPYDDEGGSWSPDGQAGRRTNGHANTPASGASTDDEGPNGH